MPIDLEVQADIKADLIEQESMTKKTKDSKDVDESPKKNELSLNDSNNCLMLRDATPDTVPNTLKELFKNFQKETMTTADICFQLVYFVALETGFAESNAYRQCAKELHNNFVVTSYFQAQNVQRLTQIKPTIIRDSDGNHFSMKLHSIADDTNFEALQLDDTRLTLTMSAIVSGDFMIVSLTPAQRKCTEISLCSRSICLSIPRFVICALTKQNNTKLYDCLRNMDELERTLRNELFVPVRSYHFTLLDVDIYPALDGLPLETYYKIFKFLDDRQLHNLAKVSKQFSELIGKDNSCRSSSSVQTQDLPNMVSSYFEVEPYFQYA